MKKDRDALLVYSPLFAVAFVAGIAVLTTACLEDLPAGPGTAVICRSEVTGTIDTFPLPAGVRRIHVSGEHRNDPHYHRTWQWVGLSGLCEYRGDLRIPPRPPQKLAQGVAPDTAYSSVLLVDTTRSTVTIVDTTLVASRNEKLELTGVLITLLFVGSGFLIWLWRATK